MTIVTLLTDFGLADTYVGQMKGAILAIAPRVSIVDLSHAVAAQDVLGGAFLLWASVDVFPSGTIHAAVVDPGVGSPRVCLAIRSSRGDVFVGPDNGLLMPAVKRLGGIDRAVELTERRYWRRVRTRGATFHGRDIFGPVAAHLALGTPVEALGVSISDPHTIELPRPRGRTGEVLHVDTYGNLVTNLPSSATVTQTPFRLRVGGHTAPLASYYAAVEPGALLAIAGSAGVWEISARDASAAEITGARRGTPVVIESL